MLYRYHHSGSQSKQSDDLESLSSRILSPRGSFGTTSSVGRRQRRPRAFCSRIIAGLLVLCVVASFVWFHSSDVTDGYQRDGLPIDVVGVSLKPSCVTRQAVLSLNRYIKPRVIHVVTTSSEKCAVYTSFASNVECHVQDQFLDGLTVDRIGDYIEQRLGVDQHKQFKGRELSGWYMQQFLKLGSALALPRLTEHYLVWDLDMVLLSPVRLLWRGSDIAVDDDASVVNGAAASVQAQQPAAQTLVNIGGSVSPGYIASFRRLTKRGLEFAPDGSSFVTHWMVVYKPYLLEFLRELSDGDEPLGWVWRILSSVEPSTADLGFSEYASYISWVRQRYPLSQRLAKRKTWVRHPFGQTTVKLLRFLRHDRCCCPSPLLLSLVRTLGFVYTGYEVGHIEECRYSEPQHETSYGL
ncbi:hypothetical protein GPECTOR_34g794 [Gonium pectorale]|uniref:Nucleotide-diphospho-sugar transferase domain-containing protein n=1 Tax=Gonium pectorale TaxID=33097 RepID=A0A150GDH3_GONPE|nr:hypothetical protein GPECTOR_34g794 [Gonium pectorale]|eukprot:KXZ47635.1 hypothetical protein GPECTOR_34g794 [Gonium pectorale]